MNLSESGRTISDAALDIIVECLDAHGIRHEIDVLLGYRESDPFAVTMTFIGGGSDVVWTFARDLLARGNTIPVGAGDVHIAPALGVGGLAMVSIELSSPDGHLVLLAKTSDINDFIAQTFAVVPDGQESHHFDVDTMISQVMS